MKTEITVCGVKAVQFVENGEVWLKLKKSEIEKAAGMVTVGLNPSSSKGNK